MSILCLINLRFIVDFGSYLELKIAKKNWISRGTVYCRHLISDCLIVKFIKISKIFEIKKLQFSIKNHFYLCAKTLFNILANIIFSGLALREMFWIWRSI